MKGKKIIALLLAVLLMIPSVPVSAANRLTLDEAIRIAAGSSKKRNELLIDRRKMTIELDEAKKAVARYFRSRFLISFSLLFNLSITDQYEGMPKEIEMTMKIPQLQTDISNNKAEEIYTLRKAKNTVELLFYDVMLSDYNITFTEQMLADKKATHERLSQQMAMGEKVDPADVQYVKKEIEALEKSLQKEHLTNQQRRDKLGKLLNIELRSNYTLETVLPGISVTRSQLPDILAYARQNDFALNKTIANRKIAETTVTELMGMYKNHFGGYIADVNRYIATHKGNMDYDQFAEMYDYALYMADSPWYGHWSINLIFFTIKIPKTWFKLKWDGTRYLKDKTHELFTAVVEMNKLMETEAQAREELDSAINDLYNTLKELETIRKEISDNIALAEISYSDAMRENQMGLTPFMAVESEKTNLKNLQRSLYEATIDYAKTLSTFDFYTSGYISARALGAADLASGDYASGSSFLAEEEAAASDEPTWRVEQTLTDYRFSFYIHLPDTIQATHFELFTEDNQIIGSRTPVKEPLISIPITYSESAILQLKLYNEKGLAYTASIDGLQYSGTLKLTPVQQTASTRNIGTYAITNPTAFTGELRIEITDGTTFDSFALYGNGLLIGEATKGGTIIHLATSFNDLSKLSLALRVGGVEVRRLQLNGTATGTLLSGTPSP